MWRKHTWMIAIILTIFMHIGFIAWGGYVLHSMTQSLNKVALSKQVIAPEDITYVDIGIAEPEEVANTPVDETTKIDANSVVLKNTTIANSEEVKPPPPTRTEEAKVKDKPKYRKLINLKNIKLGKIPEDEMTPHWQEQLMSMRPEDAVSLQPHIIKRVEPVYDTSEIPKDTVPYVVLEFLVSKEGKITNVNIVVHSDFSVPDLSPEVSQDLDVAAIEALQQYEVEPVKNKQGQYEAIPGQVTISFPKEKKINTKDLMLGDNRTQIR